MTTEPASPDPAPGGRTLLARVGDFTVHLLNHVAAGLPQADAETLARRLALCRECPHLTKAGVCDRCGCVMSIKAKWADQKCPLGKW